MSIPDQIEVIAGPVENRIQSPLYSAEFVKQYLARVVKADLDRVRAAPWPETDLAAIYASGLNAINPDVLMREDGGFLLYSGLSNCIFGEASAGKTALAQWAAARELLAGRHVYLVDYETTVRVWLARFRALGVPDAQVLAGFHYLDVRDGGAPPIPHADTSLVVIDSLTAAIDAGGFDPNDAQGIEAVYRQVVDPFTDAGVAALVIDHVGHADKSRPMNSIRKTGIVQGAMYRVEGLTGAPFGRDRVGESMLYLHKDNMGGLGVPKKAVVAKFVMGPTTAAPALPAASCGATTSRPWPPWLAVRRGSRTRRSPRSSTLSPTAVS